MTDIWTALAPQLEHLSPTHPREALALADAHRAEVAPPLVALLEALAADPAPAKAGTGKCSVMPACVYSTPII